MKNLLLLSSVFALFFFTSCAKHIIVAYQATTENTGTIVIAPTAYIQNSVVTLNDKLLVDKKFIKKVTILNVPQGDNDLHFSADSWAYKTNIELKEKVSVKADKENAKIVTRPPYSTGYYIVWAASVLANAIWIIRY